MAELQPKQRRFVQEYLVDLNAHQAALRAGYSPASAQRIGLDLLSKNHVAAAINWAKAEQARRTEITADRVLQESARLAFLDIRQLYDEQGNLLPLSQWPEEAAAAVAGIDSVQQYERVDGEKVPAAVLKKIRFWSKPSQLELLAKHLKLIGDDSSKTVVNVQVNVKTSLSEAFQRAYGNESRVVSNGSDPPRRLDHAD